jgi:hypothetical protein
MKKHKNEKGFALVLALILLMAMSLLGGSLIVISSGDHRSNNTSDDYQQTFYVAESALMEAEKTLVNLMMGPWVDVEVYAADVPVGMSDEERLEWDKVVEQLREDAFDDFARNIDKRDLPQNKPDADSGLNTTTPCFNSFRNINKTGFTVTQHAVNRNFGTLISAIFDNDTAMDSLATPAQITAEEERMEKFRYEFFIVNIGSASYRGSGSSVKKTSINTQPYIL